MQKFENGDEVEFYDHKSWYSSGVYIGINKGTKRHIVYYNNDNIPVGDKYIRPAQLICDEARELIDDALSMSKPQYKVKVNSRGEYEELMSFVNAHIKYYKFFEDFNQYKSFNENTLPELNLKTGEVTGGEEIPPPASYEELYTSCSDDLGKAHDQLKEKDAKIKLFEKEVTDRRCEVERHRHKANKGIDLLKEKDAEITYSNELNAKLLNIKDAEIEKSKENYKGLCEINQGLHNEIEKLKEANKIVNNCYNIVIQERDQWRELALSK